MRESTINNYKLVIDEWFVNGFNGTKAYQKFYPNSSTKTADKRFRELTEIDRISKYKTSKQNDKSKELDMSLSSQLKRLNEIVNSNAKDSDRINAIKEQNKLLGLYKTHNNQKKTAIKITGITFKDAPEAILNNDVYEK